MIIRIITLGKKVSFFDKLQRFKFASKRIVSLKSEKIQIDSFSQDSAQEIEKETIKDN